MVDQSAAGMVPVVDLGGGKKVFLKINDAAVIKLDAQKTLYLFGEVFYWFSNGKKRRLIGDMTAGIKAIFLENALKDIIYKLEGQYVAFLADTKTKQVRVFGDRYARVDTFYANDKDNFVFANSLDSIFEHVRPVYDQRMLAHFFAVYGWYTPKGFTLYSNVAKSRVGEILTLTARGITNEQVPFKPAEIKDLGDGALEEYHQALRFSLAARCGDTKEKVWVSSSSGWDSSIILGLLVDMYGPKRVGMMTGSMLFSDETGEINKFELDKVKKIGAFYGIKPDIVDLDYKRKSAVSYWKKVAPWYKAKQVYSLPAFNFARISDAIASNDGVGRQVFNGETSDSFHNFGFSQFCTFFHTVKSFTEYGDKMNCYLYGPTFLKKVLNGSYPKDKVYQIFRKMMPGVDFQDEFLNQEEMLKSYFLPLFYGGPRLPFAKTINNPLFNAKTVKVVGEVLGTDVAPGLWASLNEKNIYSWIIHIYLSMHSQGSTVNLHNHAMELNGHRWRSPFNDAHLISILSQAPESWGRGLDFNHTKYPLKWVAQNKVKFPYDVLQEGAHSYLYDVVEGFSLHAEILYRSGFTEYYRQILADRSYRQLFNPSYFDVSYLDRLASAYIQGKEVKGVDFTNTVSLITLCKTGWYC